MHFYYFLLLRHSVMYQMRGVNGQIPGPNQHIERQEVALPKQMHMSVAM